MLTLCAAVCAVAQDETPQPNATLQYFGHLSSPAVPGLRVTNVRIGDVSTSTTARIGLPQNVDVGLRMRLALTDTQIATTGMRVRVSSPTGSAEETFWIPTREWRVGEAREWSAPLRVPPFTASGPGTLTISQLVEHEPGPLRLGDGVRIPVDEAVLYRAPIVVEPAPAKSRVNPEMLEKAFGEPFVRLDAAVRLTRGANVQLDVDPAAAESVVGLGLVWAIGGGFDVDSGTPCVELRDQSADDEWVFLAGDHGSFVNAAIPPPGIVKLRAQSETVTAPFADWQDNPAGGNVYFAVQRFPDARPAAPLTVTCRLDSGFVDIFDVVLLTGEQTAP